MIDKTLPHDTLAESGIIATLIRHPSYILHSEYLKPSYFYQKEMGAYYWAISELYKQGIDKIDTFNLVTMLNSNKGVKNIIESSNIRSVQEFIELSSDIVRNSVEEYLVLVNKVVSLSFKRDLYNKLINYENLCLDEKITDLNLLNKKIFDDLTNLSQQYITDNNIRIFGEMIDDLWAEICNRRGENGIYGIPSKYPSIGKYFSYEPSEMFLFQARMKRGKSAFMMNEALHKIKNSIPTAYFDSEMSSRLFFERVLASLTKIPIGKIKTGNYSKSEESLLKSTMEWIKKQPFVHIYDPNWTNDKIYTTCKILQYKINLKFLVYDYIKSNTLSSSEQYNELGAKADFLKNNIAGNLNIVVLCGAQLNRQGQTADSDKLERYASCSMIWSEKSPEEIAANPDCGNYKLNIKLNRIGQQMNEDEYIDFIFNGSTMTIEESAKQHEISTPFEL